MSVKRLLGSCILAAVAFAAAPSVVADEMKRMGILFAGSASQRSILETVLIGALRDQGYVEGRNLQVTRRYAGGDYDRLANYARELESMKPDVVVTMCTPSTRAMSQASSGIPIVMTMIADPVGQRLVASLAQPGGNLTGTASMQEELVPKMLENFAAVLPANGRVAVLYNVKNPVHSRLWAAAEESAGRVKLRVKRYDIANKEAMPGVLDSIAHDRQDGIFILPDDPMLTELRVSIAAFGTRNRMPTLHATSEFVDAGGLMSYGQSFADGYRQAAGYVDRILKGTKPQTLPVAQPPRCCPRLPARRPRASPSASPGSPAAPTRTSAPTSMRFAAA